MKRFLFSREKVQRGCRYCADVVFVRKKTGIGVGNTPMYVDVAKYCPYPECPYRELDKCKSFAAYLKQMEKEHGTVARMLSGTFKQK